MPSQAEDASIRYLVVISPAVDLIMLRVPWPLPVRWRAFMKTLTSIARERGIKRKDISSVECADVDLAKIEAAYAGDCTVYKKFVLYDWKDGAFVLARAVHCEAL